nr:RNA-directed DNA polymerase, eukaryota [Tanacetum cinerariifolium]
MFSKVAKATSGNPARYERPKAPLNHNVVNANEASGTVISVAAALILDDSCIVDRDLSKHAMGKVKVANSIPNLRTILRDEGFSEVNVSYLGGLWVLFECGNVDIKDNLMRHIDNVDASFGRKRLCIMTKQPSSIFESFKVIFKGKVLMVRAKELVTWNPILLSDKEMEYSSDDESEHNSKQGSVHALNNEVVSNNGSESDVEGVSKTMFEVGSQEANGDTSAVKTGGTILGLLEDMIRVGQAMGYKMDGCAKDLECIIGNLGADDINSKLLFVAIYAPQPASAKRVLWDYVSSLVDRWNGEAVIMGDFNEVRSKDERRGSCFNPSSYRAFDHFISSTGLVDVKLKGYAFTWSHPSGDKMSKLDRFLVSEGEVPSDFGPIPFRFYHSWFNLEGFDDMVKQTWCSFSYSNSNGMIHFKKKLQDLKIIIRGWVKNRRAGRNAELNSIKFELSAIDKEVDSGVVSESTLLRRMDLQPIRGVFEKGKWVTDPSVVKQVFCKHFEARFKEPATQRLLLNVSFNKRLIDIQSSDLESNVTRDEIRSTVWSCGESKSPGLDGYSFEFFKKYWNFVGLDLVNEGIFKGVQLNGSINISHLFYADDVMFIEEWSDANLKGIINILQCFFLASGLKINIHKSQVMGVGIPSNIVKQAAASLGCGVLLNQFRYLGVMVGKCMSRHEAWEDMVLKLRSRLSKWKIKTLSIGGRLTLLKSILGASPLYYMSIFKVPKGILKRMESIRSNFFNGFDSSDRKITWVVWDKILASKKNGGLGVSSFHALNRALIFKWLWRFISQDGSLWFRVIQVLYGSDLVSHSVKFSSPWCSIVRELRFLSWRDKEIVVADKLKAALDQSFKWPARNGHEQHQLEDLYACMGLVSLSQSYDRWVCDMSGDGVYQVSVVRNFLDNLFLPSHSEPTRLIKYTPIKINIFAWRARRDYLPTGVNLNRRGVILEFLYVSFMPFGGGGY